MKLAIIAVALAMPASTPIAASQPAAPARTLAPSTPGAGMPNAFGQRPGCMPIIRQIQEQEKRSRIDEHRRLNREPPAHLLLAVDRHVEGCREVTFLRRNAAPAATTPQLGRR